MFTKRRKARARKPASPQSSSSCMTTKASRHSHTEWTSCQSMTARIKRECQNISECSVYITETLNPKSSGGGGDEDKDVAAGRMGKQGSRTRGHKRGLQSSWLSPTWLISAEEAHEGDQRKTKEEQQRATAETRLWNGNLKRSQHQCLFLSWEKKIKRHLNHVLKMSIAFHSYSDLYVLPQILNNYTFS